MSTTTYVFMEKQERYQHFFAEKKCLICCYVLRICIQIFREILHKQTETHPSEESYVETRCIVVGKLKPK